MNVKTSGSKVIIEVEWDDETKYHSANFLKQLDRLLDEVWFNGSVPLYIKEFARPLRQRVKSTQRFVQKTPTEASK